MATARDYVPLGDGLLLVADAGAGGGYAVKFHKERVLLFVSAFLGERVPARVLRQGERVPTYVEVLVLL